MNVKTISQTIIKNEIKIDKDTNKLENMIDDTSIKFLLENIKNIKESNSNTGKYKFWKNQRNVSFLPSNKPIECGQPKKIYYTQKHFFIHCKENIYYSIYHGNSFINPINKTNIKGILYTEQENQKYNIQAYDNNSSFFDIKLNME